MWDAPMWKEVARHYRFHLKLAEHLELVLKRRLNAEHDKRVRLVNAMTSLLPKMASGENLRICYVCGVLSGHLQGCAYIQALEAVAEAGRSVEA